MSAGDSITAVSVNGGDGGSSDVKATPTALSGNSGDVTTQSSATNTGDTGASSSTADASPTSTTGNSGDTGGSGKGNSTTTTSNGNSNASNNSATVNSVAGVTPVVDSLNPAVADPGKSSSVVNAATNNSAVNGNGSVNTSGGSGQTNTSTGNSGTSGGQITADGVAGTGNSGNAGANDLAAVTPPPGPNSPTSSGTAHADDTSVASGSGLALDNSVASGDAVALHGSVASGCSTAIDHSTASGGNCKPAAPQPSKNNPAHGGQGAGPALAFTGLEAFQMALAGAIALALGGLLVAFASIGRREEATA